MIKVLGRLLSQPAIGYKDRNLPPSGGSWNLSGGVQFKNATQGLRKWDYLAIRKGGSNTKKLNTSIEILVQALRSAGITADSPTPGKIISINDEKDTSLTARIKEAAGRSPNFLLVILPDKDIPLYNTIKKLGDVEFGVPTVCVIGSPKKFYDHRDNSQQNAMQYCANVALKINLKLGGTNHVLAPPSKETEKRVAIISEGKTMVVGIDVTHPGPGSASASIAAMVASIDADLAQWPADLRVQIRTRQEMVTLLGDMLKSRLLLWKKHHNVFPENILVYRDGVSESQYTQVLDDEFKLMQDACPALYAQTKQRRPRFTLVIVGKRHHTRFFVPPFSEAWDRSENPKCGLVVDRGITEARTWDFFLQSHTSGLGTARPSHYVVLWDEIFTNPQNTSEIKPADLLEQVTYDLCYLYGRATKAVSLCTPVYYADIACDRAGRYIADRSFGSESGRSEGEMNAGERERVRADLQRKIDVHQNLKDTMFYI